jgi:hypothetical protein
MFLDKKRGWSGFTWVTDLSKARFFKKPGHAKNVISNSYRGKEIKPVMEIVPLSVTLQEEEADDSRTTEAAL